MKKYNQKSELLVEKIIRMEYEEVILHTEITSIIEVDKGTARYDSIVQEAKKILLNDYNRHIQNIRGIGYKITHPDDYVVESAKSIKRGVNAIKKGENIINHAPVAAMSIEGRDAYRKTADRIAILSAAAQGANVEVKLLSKKRNPLAACVHDNKGE